MKGETTRHGSAANKFAQTIMAQVTPFEVACRQARPCLARRRRCRHHRAPAPCRLCPARRPTPSSASSPSAAPR
eukprot:258863-Chlamydomonas_euryale.AAC.2